MRLSVSENINQNHNEIDVEYLAVLTQVEGEITLMEV